MEDETKVLDTPMENSSGETKGPLSRHLYGNLYCAELNQKAEGFILLVKLIDVAAMLIEAMETIKTNSIQRVLSPNMPDEHEAEKYSKSDSCQIMGHLLTCCRNVENEDRLSEGIEMMNMRDIDRLDRYKQDLGKCRVDVNSDCIFITDLQAYDRVYTFSSYGYEFAQELLCFFGYSAELV